MHFSQHKCVIEDGKYGILVIVKDVHAIHALTRKLGQDHKLVMILFQVKDGCIMTHVTSHIEVDDEVCIQYAAKQHIVQTINFYSLMTSSFKYNVCMYKNPCLKTICVYVIKIVKLYSYHFWIY